ncbi:MAG TPA: alginate lyase family protein [Pyrinomonadaceae bacterium]|nr:alginate lyase family protein [Pyrinomonadaceae bacterium]
MTTDAQTRPATLVLNGEELARLRANHSSSSDVKVTEWVNMLSKRADRVIENAKVYSVMNKSQTPPSGDKHDYMSQAPYWWADPAKPGGLPYIRRDGQRNPELSKISDSHEMGEMLSNAETLAFAYYFTGKEKFAEQAARVLRAWFIDPRTRQNPNLNFGQGIPGISSGRGIGLIETRHLYRAIDASILISESKSWTANDREDLKKWFSDFLRWMLESPIGKDEADEHNNHGTYYDVQVIAYAIYTGQKNLAVQQLEVTKDRIKTQIEPDGRQPRELARTLSWGYANMNLLGFFTLARLAESVGVDLWRFRTSDGRGIRKAFEWLLPFIGKERPWTFEQIKPRTYELTVQLLRTAATKFKNPEYAAIAVKLRSTAAAYDIRSFDF